MHSHRRRRVSRLPTAARSGMVGWMGLPLAAFLFACSTAPTQECPDDPLLDRVQQEETLRVIVTLNLETTPESELTEQEVEEQRQRIREIQDELIAELEGTDAEVIRRYERFAILALGVGETALCRILTSGLVRDVEEDQPDSPSGAAG